MTLSIFKAVIGHGEYHLNYHLKNGQRRGRWIGSGSPHLGLVGHVTADQFRALLRGYSPDGTQLVQIQGRGHQVGWDLTYSAPKPVSVFWSRSGEILRQIIEECQDQGVLSANAYMEDAAARTRRGKGGVIEEPVGLVIADFPEDTSRLNDPQIHHHSFALNIGVRGDSTTGTIVSRYLYQHKMAAGALYRAELAYQLEKRLGLLIEAKKNGFGIRGVPERLIDEFSKRRKAILAKLEKRGLKTAKAAAVAALDTRGPKQEVDRETLFAAWRKVSDRFGFTEQAVQRILNRAPQHDLAKERDYCWSEAIRSLSEGQSHFSEREVLRRVAELAPGRGLGAKAIRELVREELANSPDIIQLEEHKGEIRFATREMVTVEDKKLRAVDRLKGKKSHPVSKATLQSVLKSRPTITEEQAKALQHVTCDSGDIAVVSGMAGTGKTFMLAACREAWERSGYEVHGAALAGKAAKGLEEGAGIPSTTIAAKLRDLESGKYDTLKHHARQLARAARKKKTYAPPKKFKVTKKTILVVDEAGMVGTRQMQRLIEAVEEGGGKIVLVGDAKQLQPVDAGGPFAAIASRVGQAELKNITRQKDEWARNVVHELSRGNSLAALRLFEERGLLALFDTEGEAIESLVADWAEHGISEPEKNLILTATNDAVTLINQLCQLKRLRRFANAFTKSIGVGDLTIYTGDRVLFTRNSKQFGVSNGDLGTVTRISHFNHTLTAKLDRGGHVLIPLENYDHIGLGFAVSSHKAQGMTVDNAYVLLGGPMQDREISYVQASRARHTTRLYATPLEVGEGIVELAKQMEKSRAKDLAHDHMPPVVDPHEKSEREKAKQKKHRARPRDIAKRLKQIVAQTMDQTPNQELSPLPQPKRELLLRPLYPEHD